MGASKGLGIPFSTGLPKAGQTLQMTSAWHAFWCQLWANGSASLDTSRGYEKGASLLPGFGVTKSPRSQPTRHPEGRKTEPDFLQSSPSGASESATKLGQKVPVSMEAVAQVPHARQAGVCLVGTLT